MQRATPAREEHHLPFLRRAEPRQLTLADGEAWSTQSHRAGLVVRCESGKLWVTVEGDPEDHILLAPDVFIAPTAGRVAVLALSSATLEVTPAPHHLA